MILTCIKGVENRQFRCADKISVAGLQRKMNKECILESIWWEQMKMRIYTNDSKYFDKTNGDGDNDDSLTSPKNWDLY